MSFTSLFFKSLVSRQARRDFKELRRNNKYNKMKLIMTLLIKDEEDIIEQNIRFHCAMGCDGFIVMSHNSTDKTNSILEKLKDEGLVLEIIYQDNPKYLQSKFVKEMIDIATKKYHASWIINADADEFYYSKSLNLKTSIIKDSCKFANVLLVDSTFLFPDDRENYLTSPYFVTNPFTKFRAQMLNINNDNKFSEFIGSQGCTKVIHKSSGNPCPYMGNHGIDIKHKRQINSSDIVLYHYHVRNFKQYENKMIRWINASNILNKNEGTHIKPLVEAYKQGKLKDIYNKFYSKDMMDFLIKEGVVTRDLSVRNFLKYKKII